MNTCEDFIFLHGSKIKIVSVTSFVLMKARPRRVVIATPACVWIVGVTVREKFKHMGSFITNQKQLHFQFSFFPSLIRDHNFEGPANTVFIH